jgi:hypothetical protein
MSNEKDQMWREPIEARPRRLHAFDRCHRVDERGVVAHILIGLGLGSS